MNIVKKLVKRSLLLIGLVFVLFAGCDCPDKPEVKIFHSPVVAKSNETVTFTATVVDDGTGPVDVQILVNAALVKTCSSLSTGQTCSYTGGPYSAYEGTTVSYLANAKDGENETDSKGYYYFAVTDGSYNWSLDYMPARRAGSSNFDLLFHKASDYTSFGNFVDDVEDKMYDVLAEQAIIERPRNYDDFNFYIYSKTASGTSNCGTVHADTDTDVSFRDFDVVLHTANITDCTSFSKGSFSAEGSNTKAFLHESGHAVFGLADEYDGAPGCNTFYFEPADEPNIWDTEAECRSEQTNKGRDPDTCRKFTNCASGWWGIHLAADGTVMQIGMVGNPWGIEGREHVRWWFAQAHP